MMYERVWTVRFSDTDMHGIAHYPPIVDAVHETSDMFMEEIEWPYWRTDGEAGFGLPLVEANFEFQRPLHGGDKVSIGLTTELGNKSVRFGYEARVDDEVKFTASEQRIYQAMDEEGARPLPDYLRDAMAPYTK
jgi:4-hydroxybenzoyl-CoA thioesterase